MTVGEMFVEKVDMVVDFGVEIVVESMAIVVESR